MVGLAVAMESLMPKKCNSNVNGNLPVVLTELSLPRIM